MKKEVLKLVQEFYRNFLLKKPSVEKMRDELKFMRMRLKPVYGDLTDFVFYQHTKLVQILWFIGKLDEFLQKKEKENVSSRTLEQALSYINEFYFKQMIKDFPFEEFKNNSFELEVIKERVFKKHLN